MFEAMPLNEVSVSVLPGASTVTAKMTQIFLTMFLCASDSSSIRPRCDSNRILKGTGKNLHCTMCEIRRAALVSLHVNLPWAKSCFTCRANRYLERSTEMGVIKSSRRASSQRQLPPGDLNTQWETKERNIKPSKGKAYRNWRAAKGTVSLELLVFHRGKPS